MPLPDSTLPATRVALITGGLQSGGATTFLCNLGGELVRRKVPVRVLSFEKENPHASDFDRLGVPVLCLDDRRQILEDRLLAVLHELCLYQPTVVVANLAPPSFEIVRYVPAGVFRVGLCHTDHAREYEMIRHYRAHLDLIAAVSETIRARLGSMPDFAGTTIRYLPLGVPMPGPSSSVREIGQPLRILSLGRLVQDQKRAHLLPQIFDQLKSAGIPFHWTLAGDGPEKASLEQAMRSSAHQTVTFLGSIPYSEVPSLLLQQDVFLLVSDYEGLPLVLLETMGAGLVPVVSDLPSGIRELVDESTGKRISPDNLKGYAEAIVWLHQHREEMKKLSLAAHEKVLHEYSLSAMGDRWLKAFPVAPAPDIDWSKPQSIKPPLVVGNSFRFSAVGRMLRRLRYRMRP